MKEGLKINSSTDSIRGVDPVQPLTQPIPNTLEELRAEMAERYSDADLFNMDKKWQQEYSSEREKDNRGSHRFGAREVYGSDNSGVEAA